MGKFVFGSFVYYYALIRQDRKTLSLTVTPDLRIIVKAPNEATPERIEVFLKKKWFWLEKQLSFFKKYQRKVYVKEYISGESFWYLGRQYQLIVKRAEIDRVMLTNGKLTVFSTKSVRDGAQNKRLLSDWYDTKRTVIFSERLEVMLLKFGRGLESQFIIREMTKRWGSFLKSGKIILNPKLINASKECIDYVIAHELCHLKYKKHNTQFYNLLTNKFPKWEKVKEKLENYPI